MIWTMIWDMGISLGFAIEPVLLWQTLSKEDRQATSPQRLRGVQWLGVGLVAGIALAGCVAWPPVKWALLTVMLGYGDLWMRGLYPASMLDG